MVTSAAGRGAPPDPPARQGQAPQGAVEGRVPLETGVQLVDEAIAEDHRILHLSPVRLEPLIEPGEGGPHGDPFDDRQPLCPEVLPKDAPTVTVPVRRPAEGIGPI